MASPGDDKPLRGTKELKDKVLSDYRQFCYHIGHAVTFWQDLELTHYALFLTMARLPENEISSVIYFSIESFETRHRMLSRMAAFFLVGRTHKKHRAEWQELEKAIKDANDNRNKVVHYSTQYDDVQSLEQPDGSLLITIGELRLQPAPENFVSRHIGRTPDKPEHNLSNTDIERYVDGFRSLAKRIRDFNISLSAKPPHEPAT